MPRGSDLRRPFAAALFGTLVVSQLGHVAEHAAQMIQLHLTTGAIGSPGLLSRGGIILGGVPLARPDLHFLYNVMEVVPLLIGYVAARQGDFGGARQHRRSDAPSELGAHA